ncbi:MAG: ATP-dependent DNA helicase, partial [Candidatus Thiodiazotropha taylori]
GFIVEQEISPFDLPTWQNYLGELQQQRRATCLMLNEQALWVAAERLQALTMVCPDGRTEPAIEPLPAEEAESFDRAIIEILRSRLESLGPVTLAQLAEPLGLSTTQVDQALASLEQEGYAIQGHFDPSKTGIEWCERGLLARIHRYTLKQLRNEIAPVSPGEFMAFLFSWQGLDEPAEGSHALQRVIGQLEGVSLPAASWEEDVLPSRLQPYFSGELDQLCSSGQLVWLRLHAPEGQPKGPKNPAIKTTPLAFILRSNLPLWCQQDERSNQGLSATAVKIHDVLKQWGASFFDELKQQTGLLKTQLENGLGELVAWGLVTSDQFQGLRSMITPQKSRRPSRRRNPLQAPLASGGRWSLVRPSQPIEDRLQRSEQFARILLNRYGVVFRKLLDREQGLPPWRDLLYALRRMEARGEIRGGRFVDGFAGEHFALPEAVGQLRELSKQPDRQHMITISSADPLNLTGIITPGKRIPAQLGHRILYQDGKPVAAKQGKTVTIDDCVPENEHWQIHNLLTRQPHPANYHKSEPGPPL